MLQPEEKMVLTSWGWMNVLVPFPAWAMKESEVGTSRLVESGAVPTLAAGGAGDSFHPDGTNVHDMFPINLPED
jgi:hypothetical protein